MVRSSRKWRSGEFPLDGAELSNEQKSGAARDSASLELRRQQRALDAYVLHAMLLQAPALLGTVNPIDVVGIFASPAAPRHRHAAHQLITLGILRRQPER